MGILLGIALSAAGATIDTAARARAFAAALLGPKPPSTMPYAAKSLTLETWTAPNRNLPKIKKSLTAFHQVMTGCSVGGVSMPFEEEAYPTVSVTLNCPYDAAHADNQIALQLHFTKGRVDHAFLQYGFPPPAPPAPIRN